MKRVPFIGNLSQGYLAHLKGSGYNVVIAGHREHAETVEDAANRERAARDKQPVKIRMLSTREGSPDGIRIEKYLENQIYEIPSSLAAIFISEGWAEAIEPGTGLKF